MLLFPLSVKKRIKTLVYMFLQVFLVNTFSRKRLGDSLVDENQKYILNLFFVTGHQPNIPVQ